MSSLDGKVITREGEGGGGESRALQDSPGYALVCDSFKFFTNFSSLYRVFIGQQQHASKQFIDVLSLEAGNFAD